MSYPLTSQSESSAPASYRLVLASKSPRRQELLGCLGLKFECIPSNFDETTDLTDPAELVEYLAKSKAEAVAQKIKDSATPKTLVLGADTVVVLGKDILGQPTSREDAYQTLTRMSGRCHKVYTGIAVVDVATGNVTKQHCISNVYFRSLDPSEVRAYVKTDEPLDKAGSYALQGTASAFVEKIEGCYTNIIGLPVPATVKLLRQFGIQVLGMP